MRGPPPGSRIRVLSSWAPPETPSASRAQTEPRPIRQTEYQEALRCSKAVRIPQTPRDYELLHAARDVLNVHRDRGFEWPNSFLGAIWAEYNISLIVIEIDTATSPASNRAMV